MTGFERDRRNRAIYKYLEQHAESEAGSVVRDGSSEYATVIGDRTFDHVVVIPCFGEGRLVLNTLQSLLPPPLTSVLIILVLNARESASPEKHEANAETRRAVRDWEMSGSASDSASGSGSRPTVVLMDRAAPGRYLPEKEGVGLARKVGCDLALAWITQGVIRSPWICCTDADALLPPRYFQQLPPGPQEVTDTEVTSALIYRFRHRQGESEQVTRAILLYECFLRYQVLGLRYAGSPYAFHTIGSTIAVNARSYAAVRGVPRRMAGEDFYFLNKLAKVGRVRSLGGAPIELDSRVSDRVPFGTGRAMTALQSSEASANTYALPSPIAFDYLRAWLACIQEHCADMSGSRELCPDDSTERWTRNLKTCCRRDRSGWETSPDSTLAAPLAAPLDASLLRRALEDQDAFAGLDRVLATGSSPADRLARGHVWFDAFRTLKLLHTLRDLGCEDVPFLTACSTAPFLPVSTARLLQQSADVPTLNTLSQLRDQFESAESDS